MSSVNVSRGLFPLGAKQDQDARRAEREERNAEPKALALARFAAQVVERQTVSRGDFAAPGEVLSQAVLLLFRHLPPAPLDLLLHRAQAVDLAQPAHDAARGPVGPAGDVGREARPPATV